MKLFKLSVLLLMVVLVSCESGFPTEPPPPPPPPPPCEAGDTRPECCEEVGRPDRNGGTCEDLSNQ